MAPRPRRFKARSRPLPELEPGQQWEVDSSLVDPDGLVARATGATNGSRTTAGPGIAAVAAWLPARVVENDELARSAWTPSGSPPAPGSTGGAGSAPRTWSISPPGQGRRPWRVSESTQPSWIWS